MTDRADAKLALYLGTKLPMLHHALNFVSLRLDPTVESHRPQSFQSKRTWRTRVTANQPLEGFVARRFFICMQLSYRWPQLANKGVRDGISDDASKLVSCGGGTAGRRLRHSSLPTN